MENQIQSGAALLQPRIVRHLCECGSDMVMSRDGYPLCRKTAEEYQAKYRDPIIKETSIPLAVCDCRKARRKNGSRVCVEPDYETHKNCPECGIPWAKFILPNVQGDGSPDEKSQPTR